MEQYQAVKHLGTGACDAVVLVRHVQRGRLYVMKMVELNEQRPTHARRAVLKEAMILSQLKHPHIVTCHHWFFDMPARNLCIVLDYCDAGTVGDHLQRCRELCSHLDELQLMQWFVQVVMAVAYLHDRRILHHDLKPSNVFLTRQNVVKVGDFGIAKEIQTTRDTARACISTPCYLSPELCQNQPYNTKSDVWALGCLLYEMCALRPAFDAANIVSMFYTIVKGDYASIPDLYSKDLARLIRTILAVYPSNRPTADAILVIPYVQHHLDIFIDDKENLKMMYEERRFMLRTRGCTPSIFRRSVLTDSSTRLANLSRLSHYDDQSDNGSLRPESCESFLQSPRLARRQRSKMRQLSTATSPRSPSPMNLAAASLAPSPYMHRRHLEPLARPLSAASLNVQTRRSKSKLTLPQKAHSTCIDDLPDRPNSASSKSASSPSTTLHATSKQQQHTGQRAVPRVCRSFTAIGYDSESSESDILEDLPLTMVNTADDSDGGSNSNEIDERLDIALGTDTPELELQNLIFFELNDDSDENDELHEWSDMIICAKEARQACATLGRSRRHRFEKVMSDVTPETKEDSSVHSVSSAFARQLTPEKSKSWSK